MHFTSSNLSPKSVSSILQDLYCRFCRLRLSHPSKLVISKKWKSRITSLVHSIGGFFSDELLVSKARALGAAGNAPDPVSKNHEVLFSN